MFTHETKETIESCVRFDHVDSNVLEQLVMFLKTDTVGLMSSECAYGLALLAHTYNLPLLFKKVEDLLFYSCCAKNEDQIAEVAYLFKSRKLFYALGRLPWK